MVESAFSFLFVLCLLAPSAAVLLGVLFLIVGRRRGTDSVAHRAHVPAHP